MAAAWMRGRWRRLAKTATDLCDCAYYSPCLSRRMRSRSDPPSGSPAVTAADASPASMRHEESRTWMTVGERRFAITLTDNAAARAFAAQLPLTLDMSELNGNEKHVDLPKPLPANASRPGTIRNGDLMLSSFPNDRVRHNERDANEGRSGGS
jgi:Cyclophilin-like family